MSKKYDEAALSLGLNPSESLDDHLKRAQLMKAARELRNLDSPPWNVDLVSRLVVAILVVAAAAFALFIGVPQAKLDLANTVTQLNEKTKQAAELDAELKANSESISNLEERGRVLSSQIESQRALLVQPVPSPNPPPSTVRHNVFIQFAGSITRGQIDNLRENLTSFGFNAPPAVRKNSGQGNEVRYLASLEQGERLASEVQRLVQQAFAGLKCPLNDLPISRATAADAVPFEVTLMHNCRTE